MPRKPKPPPVYDLRVQGLSGGATRAADVPLAANTFVDDFTGESVALAPQVVEQAQRSAARVRTREQVMQAAKRKHVQTIEERMQRHREHTEEFIRKRMQPTLRAPASAGQRAIKLTEDLVIIVPAKPWRRL